MAGSNLCPELCALLVPPAPLHHLSQNLHLNRSHSQQPEEPRLWFPLLGILIATLKLATSCWVRRRATTCRPFFHRRPDRAVISPQKPSIQQKSSRYSLRTAAPVNLNSCANNSDPPGQRGAAGTTDRVSVHLRCSAPSAATETCMTGQTRVLPVIPAPEEHEPVK